MICNRCGNYEKEGTRFCSRCGNYLVNQPYPNANYNNYSNYSNYNNNYNNGKNNSDGMAIASLIIGIIAILLSFIFNILIIPLAIVGFILGVVSKAKGVKIAGIILNILSVIIGITVIVLYLIYGYESDSDFTSNNDPDADYDYHYGETSKEEQNAVSGIWNCKSFDGNGPGKEYIVTMKLNNDLTFSWSKYNDEKNNHVYGHYTYEDEHKQNNSGEYKYYMINLEGEEFVNEGKLQDEKYISKYEMGFNNKLDEAIMMNVNTYNMYYCFKN